MFSGSLLAMVLLFAGIVVLFKTVRMVPRPLRTVTAEGASVPLPPRKTIPTNRKKKERNTLLRSW